MKMHDVAEEWLRDMPQQFQGRQKIEILVRAFARQIQEVQSVFEDLNTKLDLHEAVGKNLDYIGTIIPLSRKEAGELCGLCLTEQGPVLSDERYVQILKYKLLKNTSECTYYDIMAGLEYLYDFPFLYREDPQYPATIILGMDLDLDRPDFTFYRRLCLKPGGVRIFGEKKFLLFFLVPVQYENQLTMISVFYPRCNIPEIFLDEKTCLDGNYPLNGYKNRQDNSPFFLNGEHLLDGGHCLDGFWEVQIPEFYPARLTIRGELQKEVRLTGQFHVLLEAMLSANTDLAMKIDNCFYPRKNLALLYLNGEDCLSGEDLLNGRIDTKRGSSFYLDGKAELDGGYRLNGRTDPEELCLLELNGETKLDGEYLLNGYGSNADYEFYPARLQVFGEYRPKTGLSGEIRSVIGVQLPLPAKGDCGMRIGGRFYPRFMSPPVHVNGEARIDGEYALNGCEERDNIPPCIMNGETRLDWEYKLNGYKDNPDPGFYPLNLQLKGNARQKIEASVQSQFLWETPFHAEVDSGCILTGELEEKIMYRNQTHLSSRTKETVLCESERMTVEKHLWYLDGNKGLDGQVCLDADIYEIEF